MLRIKLTASTDRKYPHYATSGLANSEYSMSGTFASDGEVLYNSEYAPKNGRKDILAWNPDSGRM